MGRKGGAALRATCRDSAMAESGRLELPIGTPSLGSCSAHDHFGALAPRELLAESAPAQTLLTMKTGTCLRTVVEKPHFAGVQFVIRGDHFNPAPPGRIL